MATKTESTSDDGVFTIDTRPVLVPVQADNRPDDDLMSSLRGPLELRPSDRVPIAQRAPAIAETATETPIWLQIGSVFVYAMGGAVMFHMGWWLLTG